MRIAVVGAGVSGLVSAYLLSKMHDVTLFERNDYFGGHSNTVSVREGIRTLGLDTGFVVFNEPAYPRFSNLMRDLGVMTQPSDMSFSVTCKACDLSFSSRGLAGALTDPRGLLKARNARFALDMLRFYREAPLSIDDLSLDNVTLDAYLGLRGFGDEFKRHFIVPLAAAVWSTPPGEIDAFPARYMLRFLHNHGLIGKGDRWGWRTVSGGSQSYVRAILARLGEKSVCRTGVVKVERALVPAADPRGKGGQTLRGVRTFPPGPFASRGEVELERRKVVRVTTQDGNVADFDAVVMACHADEARALLVDAGEEESAALGCFDYTSNRVVLHTDASMLPGREAVRSSWNYVTDDCRVDGQALGVTYHLNRLQSLHTSADYCVSVNPAREIDEASTIREFQYSHPRYTFHTLEGQRRVEAINGQRGVYFAGAHLGYGFHEDGVESAYRVATMLGLPS